MAKKKNGKKGEIKMINENIEEIVNTNETVEEILKEFEPVGESDIITSTGETKDDLEGENMTAPATDPELPDEETDKPDDSTEDEAEDDNKGSISPAVVVGCDRLNVRENPSKDAKVVCVVAKGNELTVDPDNSTEEFYKVHAYVKDVLVEGYCMKQFINIK